MDVRDGDTGWDRRLLSIVEHRMVSTKHSWQAFVKGKLRYEHTGEEQDIHRVG